MSFVSGTKVGPYEIIGSIGAGGMGEVYRARDSRLQREVAVKVLPASFAQDADRLRRFEQEARLVGALNHPNIIAIHDIGSHNSSPYFVSEMLEGKTLRRHLDGSPLPTRQAINYGIQIAHGLAAAHEKGVVHRDLKPENIFVLNDGRIKILDFGLAKLVREESLTAAAGSTIGGAESVTTPGQVLGTVGYMSPEQVRGQATDHRTDIFALGAILYEMLTGKHAFKRDSSVETLSAILKEEPPEMQEVVPNLTPGLDRIVRHCLEKNPAQRFQSASDIAFDLEMLSTQSGTGSRLKAVAEERRWNWKYIVAAVIAIFVLAGVYYAGQRQSAPSSPRFHQLTFQRGSIGGAKFAPDGQSIVYSAAWNGAQKPQAYTTRTDALMSRPIELMDTEVLSISSKGELAIRQKTTGGAMLRGMLSVLPLTGGAPRELLGEVRDAAWSPDGESLAVVHYLDAEARLEFPLGKVLYSTTTGAPSDVAVAPDGKHVAFFDHPNAGDTRGFVAVVDLSGNVKRLTKEWSDLTGLAWSPFGDEIWFTGSDVGINSALYGVNLEGRSRDLLHIPGRLTLFDISRDGKVLMANETRRQEVYGRRMSQEKEVDLSWFDWTLARSLSNDGQWVVLEEDGEGGGPEYTVFLRKTDGSPAIHLGSGMGLDISPDEKWVASTAVKQPAPTVLLPSGAGQPITLNDGNLFHTTDAHFLPDGKGLILVAAEPGKAPRTFLCLLDGSAPKPVGPEGFRGSLVSPDEKYVAGRKDRKAWLLPLSGTPTLKELPSVTEDEVFAGWTADSRSIYLGDPSSVPVRIYAMDIESGQRRLHHQHAPADFSGVIGTGSGRITPDGSFYIYTVGRTLSSLYVVEGLR